MRADDRMIRTAKTAPRTALTILGALVVAAALLLLAAAPAGGAGTPGDAVSVPTDNPWLWPSTPPRVVLAYEVPSHEYGPGHRGIDIAATGEVRSPAAGTVAFVGVVVDRPLITIDHGGGLVSTLEPAISGLSPGNVVGAGDIVGTATSGGGHAPPDAVHFGVRLDGEYINPLLLLGGVPRAILLPCC